MIINETKNTYEDIKFMFRESKRTPVIIGCRMFFIIAGLFMFAEAMNLIQKNMSFFNYLSAGGEAGINGVMLIAFIVLIFLLGILFIIFNFVFLKYCTYRNYKKFYSKWSARHMEFGDDAVRVSHEENGVKSDISIDYELFDSYVKTNNAVYIAIKMDGNKANKYLCLHDDAYISGDVEELTELLKEKIKL